ncbi:hypothetical protein I5J49_gp66 [Mycobacterium phage ThulaThula]|uniref:Uncharacterized protein n=1 Tax=Mycobacterium phage ThulaThula TaxID=2599880 RepID=A0A5J6TF91_9CAUD|nr:hypothetical protein I5J49_gp66 [Mycobacterium phage ThulaThula]QFG09108.1 hypothetical protein PBI_THULATHULA_66 [Mycobacterium phage ThulaThula]
MPELCALCDHARDEHGDGVVHTKCCFIPPGGALLDMCDCPGYEPPEDEESNG